MGDGGSTVLCGLGEKGFGKGIRADRLAKKAKAAFGCRAGTIEKSESGVVT
jgi:hypothetical protein